MSRRVLWSGGEPPIRGKPSQIGKFLTGWRGSGSGGGSDKPGFFIEASARDVFLAHNVVKGCARDVEADDASLAAAAPQIECGYGTASETAYRHLPAPPPG